MCHLPWQEVWRKPVPRLIKCSVLLGFSSPNSGDVPSGLSLSAHSSAVNHRLTQHQFEGWEAREATLLSWSFLFAVSVNFLEASLQMSHRSHWPELCSMTIPKPIPDKWNGIIITPSDQSSLSPAAGEGPCPALSRKHLAAWHLNKVWFLLAKEAWLLCTGPWCLPQQGSPHGGPVPSAKQAWEEPPGFLLAVPDLLRSLSTSWQEIQGSKNISLPLYPWVPWLGYIILTKDRLTREKHNHVHGSTRRWVTQRGS